MAQIGHVPEITGHVRRNTHDERKAELKAYRAKHGTKAAGEHFGIAGSRVRELDPGGKSKAKGYSAFTHRPK